MIWLRAEYEFGSLFSYRIPNFSPSFAMSSPIPGPSAIKLALVSSAIETTGNIEYGKRIFNIVKKSEVLVEPPDKVAISRQLIKRRKQELIAKKMQKGKSKIGKCSKCGQEKEIWEIDGEFICKDCGENSLISTFGIREYVHFSGPIKIFISVQDEVEKDIRNQLARIRQFGTSDSIVFCRKIENVEPSRNKCVQPIDIADYEEVRLPKSKMILILIDIAESSSFEDINPYTKGNRKEAFVLRPYVFPLIEEKIGKNWTIYKLEPLA
ncbi:MAG: hypothetical protein H5T41_02760 [Methanomassiliicoccales archaeon]|nr:hypothetical protein [Methanomassiliicoccales archaeon]